MKEFFITLKNSSLPKYQRLAESFRSAIRGGHLHPGEALPSTRDLAKFLKMNRHTVMNALSELVSEGWLQSLEKRGYFVTKTLPETFLRSKLITTDVPQGKPVKFHFARTLNASDYVGGQKYKHSFPSGHPDLRLFPMREFKSHLFDALKSGTVLAYGDPSGHEGLRREIAIYLRRVRNLENRTIIVTNGSQEALFLLSQILIKPGDAVAVEELGYSPAMEALRFAGAKLVPIAINEEGIVVDDLLMKLKKEKIRLFYTTPLHQYPTTVMLSATRRLQLYEAALKNNIIILEDDYDHEFHYVSQPVAPLASFDPAGLVLYVSTFSKILFPSARLGFMAVPAEIGNQIAKLKRISSRQNEQILQATICLWMQSGGFERHLRRMRRIYEERRAAMLDSFEKLNHKHHKKISWIVPDGGMAMWVNIDQDSQAFHHLALQHSIHVNSESDYRLDNRPGTHLRLGFSGHTSLENDEGLSQLFQLL
ncbi:MAG: PLP-dependent aminotransferase family protein [Candidatus Riflebacteria bacterium]|nr:PLP-dependent aminotransferase family protein [Candidatus Riflebacteria bacterium]